MNDVTWGLIVALLGALGGVFATWRGLRAWANAAERRIIWRFVIGCWLMMALFGVLMLTLPFPDSQLLWIPFPLLLIWAVVRCHILLARARAEEPD